MISINRWGRVKGALHCATTWYEPDPDGVELPGHDGRWRVVAATTLPKGARTVSESKALAEIAAINQGNTRKVEESKRAAAERVKTDAETLERSGIEPGVAARLAARLGD